MFGHAVSARKNGVMCRNYQKKAVRRERDQAIAFALQEQGTIAGAARAVGCSRRTVARLLERSEHARRVLALARIDRQKARVAKHRARVLDAEADARDLDAAIAELQNDLCKRLPELDAVALRNVESTIAELIPRARTAHARARVHRVPLDVARRSLARLGAP